MQDGHRGFSFWPGMISTASVSLEQTLSEQLKNWRINCLSSLSDFVIHTLALAQILSDSR